METQSVTTECAHQWVHFQLPAERGRVVQCTLCRLIGHKRKGQGSSKVWPFKCSAPKCNDHAKHRMFGRGPRGSYIWACDEHAVQIEGHDRSTK